MKKLLVCLWLGLPLAAAGQTCHLVLDMNRFNEEANRAQAHLTYLKSELREEMELARGGSPRPRKPQFETSLAAAEDGLNTMSDMVNAFRADLHSRRETSVERRSDSIQLWREFHALMDNFKSIEGRLRRLPLDHLQRAAARGADAQVIRRDASRDEQATLLSVHRYCTHLRGMLATHAKPDSATLFDCASFIQSELREWPENSSGLTTEFARKQIIADLFGRDWNVHDLNASRDGQELAQLQRRLNLLRDELTSYQRAR